MQPIAMLLQRLTINLMILHTIFADDYILFACYAENIEVQKLTFQNGDEET